MLEGSAMIHQKLLIADFSERAGRAQAVGLNLISSAAQNCTTKPPLRTRSRRTQQRGEQKVEPAWPSRNGAMGGATPAFRLGIAGRAGHWRGPAAVPRSLALWLQEPE